VRVRHGDEVFNEYVHFAGGDFFGVFDFSVVSGSAGALGDREQVLITQSLAKKYFGDGDPIGQAMTVYVGQPYQSQLTVGAVLADPPLNSSLRFSALTALDNLYLEDQPVEETNMKYFTDVTFVQLAPGADREAAVAGLNRFIAEQNLARPDWQMSRFELESLLTMAHTARDMRANSLEEALAPAAVWGPNVLALLILLTACLNFTNTTISLADKRLKEMGVRQVLGGTRRQLVGQLLGESLLVALLALAAAGLFASWLIPAYNHMWPYLDLRADYLRDNSLQLFLVAMLLGATLLAGSYPALYLSAFRPVAIFQGKVRFGGNNLFTRVLLGFQVVNSLVAVVSALAFARNATFQRNADLGYDDDGLIVLPIEVEQDYHLLSNALRGNPQVAGIAGSANHIAYDYRRSEFSAQGENYEALRLDVGRGYKTMNQ
jgi:hypothetical protein